jgi:hypothetical protein
MIAGEARREKCDRVVVVNAEFRWWFVFGAYR